MNDIENVIFDIAEALRVPVLVLALLALAVVLIELGAFIVELLAPPPARLRPARDRVARGARRPRARRRGRRQVRAAPRRVEHRDGARARVHGRSVGQGQASAIGSPRASPTSTSGRCGGSSARGCWCAPVPRSA